MGRFINADSFVSTGQGVLGFNMFTYCLNNPIRYEDSQGSNAEEAEDDEDDYRLVGAGVQIDFSGSLEIGSISGSAGFGFEVIIYWDTQECADMGKPIVAVYVYNEGAANLDTKKLLEQAMEIAELLLENIDLLKMDGVNAVQAILNGNLNLEASLSISISAVGVFGNSKFYGVDSYLEKFDNFSATAGSLKYGCGWSDSCIAHSLGFNHTFRKPTLPFGLPSISRGQSYYRLIWDSRNN